MEKEKNFQIILTIVTGFLVLYLIFKADIFLLIAVLTGITGVFSDYLACKIAWLWLKISELIGYIMPKVILSCIFFAILTPLAAISRFFRKDFLRLRKKNAGSYYVPRNYHYTAKDLENLW